MGPPRPSSDDHPARTVAHQAGVQAKTTGETYTFGGRSRGLARTPPSRRSSPTSSSGGSSSAPRSQTPRKRESSADSVTGDDPRQPKRKKEEIRDTRSGKSPSPGKRMIKILERVDRGCKVIAQVAQERNTKKEVKEASANLEILMAKLTSHAAWEALGTLDEMGYIRKELDNTREEAAKLKKENEEFKRKLKQLRKDYDGLRAARRNDDIPRVASEQIDGAKTFEDFRALNDYQWEDDIFKATSLTNETPSSADGQTDLVILNVTGEGGSEMCQTTRDILGRFPEAAELGEGGVTTLEISTRLETKEGMVERKRHLYKIEVSNLQDWFNGLDEVKKRMVQGDRRKVAIYPPSSHDDVNDTRRLAEIVFRTTTINCSIYTGRARREQRQPKPRTTEAILIRTERTQYADLLKEIKTKISPNLEMSDAVKTIRQTKEGNMIIIADKGKPEMMTKLNKELETIAGERKIKKLGDRREKTIIIKDMDEFVTRDDVAEAIRKVTGAESEEIEIGDLRPCFGRNQAVTVKIPPDKADIMIKMDRIRIGLNACIVSERLTVQQCYRCWGYGHIRSECKGNDHTQHCKKCGVEGHKAQDCQGVIRCLNCKREGHAAGSGACLEFRKALAKVRQKAKDKYKNQQL